MQLQKLEMSQALLRVLCVGVLLHLVMQLPGMPEQRALSEPKKKRHRCHTGAQSYGVPAQNRSLSNAGCGGFTLGTRAPYQGLPLQKERLSEEILRMLSSWRAVFGAVQVPRLQKHRG